MEQTNISFEEKPLANLENLTVTLVENNKFNFFPKTNTQFPVKENLHDLVLDVSGNPMVSWKVAGSNNLFITQTNLAMMYGTATITPRPDVSLYVTEMVLSTDISVDETRNSLGRKYAEKLLSLESKLGKQQFERLSFPQQIFMANTFGAINLGETVNIQSIYESTQDE